MEEVIRMKPSAGSRKKVIIVGAGPAGLMAARQLADYADVTIIEKGKDIDQRNLPGHEGQGLYLL